jgi:VanZ family protein
MKITKSIVPAIIWAVLITGIDLIPANPLKKTEHTWIIGPDKIIHFAQHFVLSALIFWGLLLNNHKNIYRIIMAIILPVLLGIFIEIAQELWVPNRHYNIRDIFANTLGSLTFLLFTKTIANFQKKYFS